MFVFFYEGLPGLSQAFLHRIEINTFETKKIRFHAWGCIFVVRRVRTSVEVDDEKHDTHSMQKHRRRTRYVLGAAMTRRKRHRSSETPSGPSMVIVSQQC